MALITNILFLIGIKYPVSFDDIETFEINNRISVNIYEIVQDKNIDFCRKSHLFYHQRRYINLLMLSKG